MKRLMPPAPEADAIRFLRWWARQFVKLVLRLTVWELERREQNGDPTMQAGWLAEAARFNFPRFGWRKSTHRTHMFETPIIGRIAILGSARDVQACRRDGSGRVAGGGQRGAEELINLLPASHHHLRGHRAAASVALTPQSGGA